MASHASASLWILLLGSAVLFWAALTDFREFKIRNEIVLSLAGLYIVYAIVSGGWASMLLNVLFATLALAGMLYTYWQEQLGGGDLKLLAVAFLWTGPWAALPFAILLLTFTLIYYLAARFGWASARKTDAGLRIPLAPAIAGALIATFALGFVGSA